MAYLLDGVNDGLENTTEDAATLVDLAGSPLITVCAKLKFTAEPSATGHVMKGASALDTLQWNFLTRTPVVPGSGFRLTHQVAYSVTTHNITTTDDTALGDGIHHVALVSNLTDLPTAPTSTIYIDGVSIAYTATGAADGTAPTGQKNVAIGAGFDQSGSLNGTLQEVAFWRGANLTAAQILSLSQGFSPDGINPLPTYYWDFINGARERMTGLAMTVTGATVAPHIQPVYYPRTKRHGKLVRKIPSSRSVGAQLSMSMNTK